MALGVEHPWADAITLFAQLFERFAPELRPFHEGDGPFAPVDIIGPASRSPP